MSPLRHDREIFLYYRTSYYRELALQKCHRKLFSYYNVLKVSADLIKAIEHCLLIEKMCDYLFH